MGSIPILSTNARVVKWQDTTLVRWERWFDSGRGLYSECSRSITGQCSRLRTVQVGVRIPPGTPSRSSPNGKGTGLRSQLVQVQLLLSAPCSRCSTGTSARFLNGNVQVRILPRAPRVMPKEGGGVHGPATLTRRTSSARKSLDLWEEPGPIHRVDRFDSDASDFICGVVHRVVIPLLQRGRAWVRVPDAVLSNACVAQLVEATDREFVE